MHLLLLFRNRVEDGSILPLLVMFDEMKSDKGPRCSCCRCASLISTASLSLSELDIVHGYPDVYVPFSCQFFFQHKIAGYGPESRPMRIVSPLR